MRAEVGRWWVGPAAWLGALWVAWGWLSWSLHREGAAARAVLLPIDPASYYAAQAVGVGPLVALQATVFAWVAHRLALRAGGQASLRETWAALARVYAIALLVGLVLPDLVFHAVAGRAGMARAMRVYAPGMALGLVGWATARLGEIHRITMGRAATSVVAGLLVQLVIGAPLLR